MAKQRAPTLADVRCSRINFEKGDRVLVTVYAPLDRDQRRKLTKTVQRWAGIDVEVLVVDGTRMEVTVERP